MKDRFSVDVPLPGLDKRDVWPLLRDVPMISRCSTAVSQVEELEPGLRWTARLVRRVGRFQLSAPLLVTAVEEESGRVLGVRAAGEDAQVGSRLVAEVRLSLLDNSEGSVLEVSGSYEVTGKLASLGAGAVRKHAQQMVDEFATRLPGAIELRLTTGGPG